MSPIIGVIDSAKTGRLSTTSYESIATVTGNGSATSLTFSSIPQTYKHLQVRGYMRDNRSGSDNDTIQMQFNGDTAASAPYNYSRHAIRGTGAAASYYTVIQQSGENCGIGVAPSSNSQALLFGGTIADIYDYTNTNKFKTVKATGGYDANNTGNDFIDFISSLWSSTSAITSITIVNNGNAAFSTGTIFALYGVKG